MTALQIDRRHQERMLALEAAILREGTPLEFVEKHYFAHGTYVRELHIPEDTVLTGKIHRYSTINILSKGRMLVVTDEVEEEITAPYTFVSGPGVKKALYALEDSVFSNVHPWEGPEDLDMVEEQMIVPSYEALEYEQQLLLEDK